MSGWVLGGWVGWLDGWVLGGWVVVWLDGWVVSVVVCEVYVEFRNERSDKESSSVFLFLVVSF